MIYLVITFLHLSDNPSALIVSEVFNGDNYTSWSYSISIEQSVKNKSTFTDGSLLAPSPSSGLYTIIGYVLTICYYIGC